MKGGTVFETTKYLWNAAMFWRYISKIKKQAELNSLDFESAVTYSEKAIRYGERALELCDLTGVPEERSAYLRGLLGTAKEIHEKAKEYQQTEGDGLREEVRTLYNQMAFSMRLNDELGEEISDEQRDSIANKVLGMYRGVIKNLDMSDINDSDMDPLFLPFLNIYFCDNIISPQSAVDVIKRYRNRELGKEEAMKMLEELKAKAEEHLEELKANPEDFKSPMESLKEVMSSDKGKEVVKRIGDLIGDADKID